MTDSARDKELEAAVSAKLDPNGALIDVNELQSTITRQLDAANTPEERKKLELAVFKALTKMASDAVPFGSWKDTPVIKMKFSRRGTFIENDQAADDGGEVIFHVASSVVDQWSTLKAHVKDNVLNLKWFSADIGQVLYNWLHQKNYYLVTVSPLAVGNNAINQTKHPVIITLPGIEPVYTDTQGIAMMRQVLNVCAVARILGLTDLEKTARSHLEVGLWLVGLKPAIVAMKATLGYLSIFLDKLKELENEEIARNDLEKLLGIEPRFLSDFLPPSLNPIFRWMVVCSGGGLEHGRNWKTPEWPAWVAKLTDLYIMYMAATIWRFG